MTSYRLYFLRRGHITNYAQIECASDEEAIEAAKRQGAGAVMELWQGARLVKRFDGPAESRSPQADPK